MFFIKAIKYDFKRRNTGTVQSTETFCVGRSTSSKSGKNTAKTL